jgi:hypothetical protein
MFHIELPPRLGQEGMNVGCAGKPSTDLDGQLGVDPGAGLEKNLGVDAGMDYELKDSAGYQEEGVMEHVPLGEDSSQADSMDTTELEMALTEWGDEGENNRPLSAEELVAIPEASLEQSAARRSKRRARGGGEVDEEVGALAEGKKALRNEGNSDQSAPLKFMDDALVIANLNDVGISLGIDEASISSSLVNI